MGYKKYRKIDFEKRRLNGHTREKVNGFEGIHGENGIGERCLKGGGLLEFCDQEVLCVVNAWLRRRERGR